MLIEVKTLPTLFTISEGGVIVGGLTFQEDVVWAVAHNAPYGLVYKLDRDTLTVLDSFTIAGADAPLTGIDYDPVQDSLWICSSGLIEDPTTGHIVWEYSTAGVLKSSFTTIGLNDGICYNHINDRLYVVEYDYKRIKRYTRAGVLGTEYATPSGYPVDIAFDSKRTVFYLSSFNQPYGIFALNLEKPREMIPFHFTPFNVIRFSWDPYTDQLWMINRNNDSILIYDSPDFMFTQNPSDMLVPWLFYELEITDTDAHTSLWAPGMFHKYKTIVVRNTLDQDVTITPIGRTVAAANWTTNYWGGSEVDLPSFIVPAGATIYETMTNDFPWIGFEAECLVAPTSGDLTLYMVMKK